VSGRFSKAEIDRLGERIRASERLSVEDLRILQAWRAQHADALDEVVRILVQDLGLHPTSRLKTQDTLIDKLHRETTRLSQVQDVAGCRVEVDGGLAEQDDVVAGVIARFPEAKVFDRRERPSHGYRAVHIVVATAHGLVEIQVRTRLQNLWAQIIERFAEIWGRQIQYGGEPDAPEPLRPYAHGLLDTLHGLSVSAAGLEVRGLADEGSIRALEAVLQRAEAFVSSRRPAAEP